MEPFIAELWPSSDKAKKALISLGVLFTLAIIGIVVATLMWDDHMSYYTTLSGKTVYRGWPSTVRSWSIGFAVLIPFAMAMMFFGRDRKKPALAVSETGLFVNQQLVKATFVEWKDIQSATQEGNVLNVIFREPEQIINAQGFPFKAFVKSNLNQAGGNMSFEDEGDVENFGKIVEVVRGHVGG